MDSLAEQYDVTIDEVNYDTEGVRYASVLCTPKEKGNAPAVVTIHGIFGLQEMDVRFSARLASQGYVVLAHDWQSAGTDPADADIVKGLKGAADYLQSLEQVDERRLALVGVCRGGSIAMIGGAKLDTFSALASFYGQAYYPVTSKKKPQSPIDLTEQISAPMLVVHGEEDSIFSFRESLDYCRRLESLGKTVRQKLYSDAEHGFFLEGHRNYFYVAAEDAWGELEDFLKRHV